MTASYHHLEYAPSGDGPSCIEALWETDILVSGSYLVLPDGRMDLVVRCDDTSPWAAVTGIAIIGPSSQLTHLPVRAGQRYFGVRFRPGYGGCMGVAPSTLANRALHGNAAADILGHEAQKLAAALGPDHIRDVVRGVAQRIASRAPKIPSTTLHAIDLLHASAGRSSVALLARAIAVPDRTLRRRIQEAVGLPTKVFAGVIRFQHAMRLLQGDHPPSIAQVAADCGYSDQAHLSRDFQRFGGFSPGKRLPATLVRLPILELAE